jgi:hypothetical protein
MKGLDQFLIPYLVSQAIAIIILFTAWKNTRLARLFFFLLFIWASATNMYLGIKDPDIYQEYADMAIPAYKNFINGWFSQNKQIVIPLIAVGQVCISVGMLLKKDWVSYACFGAIVFLLSIAPLGTGSAFPFSLIVSPAAWLIYRNDHKEFLWIRPNRKDRHLNV